MAVGALINRTNLALLLTAISTVAALPNIYPDGTDWNVLESSTSDYNNNGSNVTWWMGIRVWYESIKIKDNILEKAIQES